MDSKTIVNMSTEDQVSQNLPDLNLIEQTFETKTPHWIFRFRVVG